ncbi:MAG: addiction module protein [Gallionellaceae bacterium]|nr:addiction module protein [Gallionellaceae bacterium]
MSTQFEIIEAEALKLLPTDRALLAEHLIASLDEDNEIQAAWADEIKRRIAEVESGAAVGIPFSEAIAQARATLK